MLRHRPIAASPPCWVLTVTMSEAKVPPLGSALLVQRTGNTDGEIGKGCLAQWVSLFAALFLFP